MAHTQYSLSEIMNQQIIEQLLYVSNATYGKDWVSVFHSHSFAELFYVVDGSGLFCTESAEIPIQKDHLILINPNVLHTEKSSASNPLTYMVLGIDNLKFEFSSSQYDSCQIHDFSRHREKTLWIMNMMMEEMRQKHKNHEQICQHLLSVLLFRILRVTEDTFSFATAKEIPGECEFLKNYLDQNYREPLTLDVLAEASHLNKYYLSHIFTKTFGISPINYLLERRILHSKDLLKATDFSVTLVAHMTGFSSANYFSQSFKKHTGVTPLAYRKKHANF